MKLSYKRTILVGFAFFLISAFWQAYDATIPVILTNKFGMSQTWSGVIMALDNILAVFMLPIFGALSDKCRNKKGKRTPFITIGTTIAAVLLVALSFVDNAQLQRLSDVSAIDDPAALTVIYDTQAEKELVDALKSMLGIAAKVKLVAPKSITRSEGKAVRIIDKRKI